MFASFKMLLCFVFDANYSIPGSLGGDDPVLESV